MVNLYKLFQNVSYLAKVPGPNHTYNFTTMCNIFVRNHLCKKIESKKVKNQMLKFLRAARLHLSGQDMGMFS